MKTKIEELREIVSRRTESLKAGCVNQMILEAELTFIEKRHMEEYFIVAHRLFAELKKDERFLLGPGWNWMLSSHLCYVLGLSNLSPCDIDLTPIFMWGDDNSDLTIGIEVDEDSYDTVFDTAVSMFGYSNVARMPVMDKCKDYQRRQNMIGNDLYVGKSYPQVYALLLCFDGIDKHYSVKEFTDELGSKYLCAYQNIGHTGYDGVLRFEVIASKRLTRIKRIQEQIARNGKIAPALYEKSVIEEQYDQFYSDDLDGVPMFDWYSPKDLLKILLPQNRIGIFKELVVIQGLLSARKHYGLYNEQIIQEEQEKYGILNILGKKMFPWGFLYKEDAAWFLCSWGGLSWKQAAQVLLLADEKKELESERLKHTYLHQGMDNGFREDELNSVWHSLFERKTKGIIPSKAHNAGLVYLSIFMAKLKYNFPEGFNAIKEE